MEKSQLTLGRKSNEIINDILPVLFTSLAMFFLGYGRMDLAIFCMVSYILELIRET